MKNILNTVFLFIIVFTTSKAQIIDSANMTSGYALDVFYSLENGSVQSLSNTEWTVALSTGSQTASIYINDGNEVELYKTTAAVSSFTSFGISDTIGLSTWGKVYNGYQDWEHSAFEDGTTGHPDYGWGEYNSVSHIVVGNKIFLLKTLAGTYYKSTVVSKTNGAWHFRYATLNNSFDTTIIYQASDLFDRNFAYLNMDNHTILNREPVNTSWDMIFTRYYDNEISHTTTGVLLNTDVEVLQVDGVSNSSATFSGGTFSDATNEIGSDWKSFDNSSATFTLVDDRTYFIKNQEDNIYKLFFTRYDGTSTGKIVFSKQFISSGANSINEKTIQLVSVYPNPAKNIAHLVFDANTNSHSTITVFNIVGKQLSSQEIISKTGLNSFAINVKDFHNGVYLVRLQTGNQSQTIKMNVSR